MSWQYYLLTQYWTINQNCYQQFKRNRSHKWCYGNISSKNQIVIQSTFIVLCYRMTHKIFFHLTIFNLFPSSNAASVPSPRATTCHVFVEEFHIASYDLNNNKNSPSRNIFVHIEVMISLAFLSWRGLLTWLRLDGNKQNVFCRWETTYLINVYEPKESTHF